MEEKENSTLAEIEETKKKEESKHVETGMDDAEIHSVDESLGSKRENAADDSSDSVTSTEDGGADIPLSKCVCRYPQLTTAQRVTAGVVLGLAAVGACAVSHTVASFLDDD